MEELKLTCDPVLWWPVSLLIAVALLVLNLRIYRQRVAHLTPGVRRSLLALRTAAWLVLVFCLFRPIIQYSEADRQQLVFAIVSDSSRSMTVKDAPGGQTRRSQMLKTLQDAAVEIDAIGKEAALRQFEFATDLVAVDLREEAATGEQTAIGTALDAVLRLAGDRKLELLLLSDGAQRAMAPNDADPRTVARRLQEYDVRVHTVPFGASGLSDAVVDASLEELDVSPVVFVKNTVVVRGKVRLVGAAGKEAVVRLLLEDPLARSRGEPNSMKPISTPLRVRTVANETVIPVEMTFLANEPGEFRLAMQIDPLPGEPLTANNTLSTYITVQKGGVNVALFDRELHPEQKFIRRVNESPDIQLDFKPVRLTGDRNRGVPLEADWFSPGRYDVYIIGDVPARAFGVDYLQKLAKAVEAGAGLLMIGGPSSFGPGGYGGSPLGDVLPVEMRRDEVAIDDQLDPRRHLLEALPMLPSPQHGSHFIMRLDDAAKNNERWKQLPPLFGANRVQGIKPLGLLLAESASRQPLLVAQDYGRGRSLALLTDTTYLWYLAGKKEEHQRFWQQVLLWLAHKDVQTDSSVWLRLESRRLRPGQPLNMTLGARDPEKQPVTDAEFSIIVEGPQPGQKRTVLPQRASSDFAASFTETREPGEYRVTAEARKAGQMLGAGATARFLVFEQDLELFNPAADTDLLDEIAQQTGGQLVPPEKLRDFLQNRLKSGNLRPEVRKITSIPLWDNWPIIVLFTSLMTLEWIVRKRNGLV